MPNNTHWLTLTRVEGQKRLINAELCLLFGLRRVKWANEQLELKRRTVIRRIKICVAA